MVKSSVRSAIRTALVALRLIWDNTDDCSSLSSDEVMRLAKREGVSLDRRLLYAAIDAAEDAGWGVTRPRGKGRHREGVRWATRPFADWEVGFLCDAVGSSRSLSEKERSSLKSKLLLLAPRASRRSLSRQICSGLFGGAYRSAASDNLTTLNIAVTERRKIVFRYWEYSASGEKIQRASSSDVPIDPYVFLYQNSTYYLLGGKDCKEGKALRTYRVDRMTDIAILDELCDSRLEDFGIDVDDAMAKSFGLFVDRPECSVVLSFDPGITKHVVERFGLSCLSEEVDGLGRAKVAIRPSEPFYAWVFQFGGRMSIESPKEVVDEYRTMLAECAKGLRAKGE